MKNVVSLAGLTMRRQTYANSFLPSFAQSLKGMDFCSCCCWGNHFEIQWFISGEGGKKKTVFFRLACFVRYSIKVMDVVSAALPNNANVTHISRLRK